MSKYAELEALVGLEPAHSLLLASRERIKRDGTVYETRWLNEHDKSNKLVARYRTWSNHDLKPPYRKQLKCDTRSAKTTSTFTKRTP